MIRINLLPRKVAKRAVLIRRQAAYIGGAVIVALALVFLVNSSISARVDEMNARLQQARAELTDLKGRLKKLDEYKAKKADVQARVDAVQRLNQERAGPVRILDEIASRLPPQLWLKEFREEKLVLKISGWALDVVPVSQFMSALEKAPSFKKVELEEVAQDVLEVGEGVAKRKVSVKKFTIRSEISYR